jgi:hypothetical protein
MPVKLKDFLQVTFEQGDVRGDEIAAVLGASALAEIELPDAAVAKFKEVYLTRSRAENDPGIVKKVKASLWAETMDQIDAEISKLYPILDSTKAVEIEKNPSTMKKIGLLTEALADRVKNATASKDKDVQKVEEEWATKTKQTEAIFKQQIEQMKKQHEENKKDFVLKTKLFTFDLADSFKEIKEPLIETIISKIKASRTKEGNPIIFELDQSGNLDVRHDIDGTLRDVYLEGNTKLTLDSLIAPHIEPFVKKSNGSGGGDTNTGKKTATPNIDQSKATLADLRLLNAQ